MIIRRIEQVYDEWAFCEVPYPHTLYGIFNNEEEDADQWSACFAYEEDAELFVKAKDEQWSIL